MCTQLHEYKISIEPRAHNIVRESVQHKCKSVMASSLDAIVVVCILYIMERIMQFIAWLWRHLKTSKKQD